MLERIIGILKLDVPTYEAVEHDPDATTQAAIIVLLVALIGAIGGYFTAGSMNALIEQVGTDVELPGFMAGGLSPIGTAISAFINAFIGWILWAYGTYFVGTRLFGGDATPQEMLRVLGYAQAPRLLSFIPCIGFFAGIWSLVCGFIAVRQGIDLDNGKSAITILITLVLVWIVTTVIGTILAAVGLAI